MRLRCCLVDSWAVVSDYPRNVPLETIGYQQVPLSVMLMYVPAAILVCMPPHTRRSSSATRDPGRKSVLFCPACGHESPVDGDWHVQARGETLDYSCPTCSEVITERPLTEARTSPVSSTSLIPSAGGSLLARSVRLAFAWAAWPCTPTECALPYANDESSRADPTSAPMYTSLA